MTRQSIPTNAPAERIKSDDAVLVRRLVRQAWKATLGTVGRDGGFPYGSLVTIATAADGTPLLLLSGLAEHTKNIAVDNRASLLVDGTPDGPDALTGPRVTLVGKLARVEGTGELASARQRFLSRHPAAQQFIDFPDFGIFALDVHWAHLVAGFGRIVRLRREDVIVPIADAMEVVGAEAGVLQHMNEDHADAIAAMAAAATGGVSGAAGESNATARGSEAALSEQIGKSSQEHWRMVGCDPEGIDLSNGRRSARVDFPQRVTSTEQLRKVLIELTRSARDSTRKN